MLQKGAIGTEHIDSKADAIVPLPFSHSNCMYVYTVEICAIIMGKNDPFFDPAGDGVK